MENYLKSFFEICEYPEEASVSLLNDFKKIMNCEASRNVYNKYISMYGMDNMKCTRDALRESIEVAGEAGVSEFSSQLLIFCCLSKELRNMYKEKNLPDDLWRETMLDLRYKLMECKKYHNVWGSFVAFWFPEFFEMSRFTHGRLQYQNDNYWASKIYDKHGVKLVFEETPVLELHIPSAGPLKDELVLDSLKKAYKFYKEQNMLINGKLVIQCSSWLLYEKMKEFLPEDSNILKFMNNFEITYQNEDKDFGDCWRVFNQPLNNEPEKLPKETKLQKSYAEWLCKGNYAGTGAGVIIFDGENILTKVDN